MSEKPTIVIGIPGRWTDGTAIIETTAKDSAGYMFVGMTLTNLESNWSCELDVCEHDPDLRRAFETAGSGRIDDSTLDEIGAHSFTLYLSCDGGALDKARALMNAATAMLDCGGLAVKIESTGIAHTTE